MNNEICSSFETGLFQITEGSGSFLNSRYMVNLFLNRMITPEADKTRGKGS